MADSSSFPQTLSFNSQQPHPTSTSTSVPPSQEQHSSTSAGIANPTSNPPPLVSPPPPSIPSYGPPPITGPPAASSFRPASHVPVPIPQFSHLNTTYQNPGMSSVSVMGPGAATGSVPQQMLPYQIPPRRPPNPAFGQFLPIPNGYSAMTGTMPPPVS